MPPKVPRRDRAGERSEPKVRDPTYLANPGFFDPSDPVQVKYEMLRSHYVDDAPVMDAARRFGFSRQSFYLIAARFAAHRMLGLLPGRPGPKGPRKVTEEMAAFFDTRFRDDPNLRPEDLAAEAVRRFGIEIHPRTVRRRLEQQKKKPQTAHVRARLARE